MNPGACAEWEADGTVEDVGLIAETADRLGYHHLTCSEHVGLPATELGRRGARYWDPLATFGYLAARTTQIRFATMVLVLGYHHPLEIAKRYGTLDLVSGGRLILGVGIGTLEEEFDLLGAPFDRRGPRADDSMRALRASLSQPEPSYEGEFNRFGGMVIDPCAVQDRVPLWVGGPKPRLASPCGGAGRGLVPLLGLPRPGGRVARRGRSPRGVRGGAASDLAARRHRRARPGPGDPGGDGRLRGDHRQLRLPSPIARALPREPRGDRCRPSVDGLGARVALRGAAGCKSGRQGGESMTASKEEPVLVVPAGEVPVPSHLSSTAQAVLSMGPLGDASFPALDDPDGWRAMTKERDAVVGAMMEPRVAAFKGTSEELDCQGTTIYVLTPEEARADDHRVYLEFHGGGLTMGGGAVCRAMAMGSATNTARRTYSVDYRMPPDDPYPAALDDGIAAYRMLLEDHDASEIIVGGGSAGGNLAAAVILRARDEGLPLPAAAFLATPELDLTESGDSFATNLGVDTVLTASLMPANLLYANGHDLRDPYLSPLFADFTKGFPPTFLQSGTRDLFLSNTVRMHRALRAAGITAELHVIEAGPHGGFFGSAPEDAAVAAELRRFFAEH